MMHEYDSASDIDGDSWVFRLTPPDYHPYLRLMRLDRPIGIWLLLLPGLWSIALSDTFWHGLWLFLLFTVGATLMRGAGCIINDIVDRDIDRAVARTASRPLASGELTVPQALALLLVLLLVSLAILYSFNSFAFWVGVASIALIIPYPFMKRITDWPQAWLGITFNWGALLGWAAAKGSFGFAPFLLYIGGIAWTLGYDTIYALQDKEDDALVGVRSTALRFGQSAPWWLTRFYGCTFAFFALAGLVAGMKLVFFFGLALAGAHLAWQIVTLEQDDPADCLAKFKSNRYFGLIILVAILADRF